MHTINSDIRKSGIPLIGDLPWGSRFCQFYQTKKDLLEIFLPYFKTGLENNELCVWITSRTLGVEDAKKAIKKAVPHFEKYTKNGQMEIIPSSRCHAKGEKPGKVILSLLDSAVSGGFDGLRLACSAFPAKENGKPLACFGSDAISKYNVLAVFAYPRDKFDAIGLMEVVKNHRFALMKNTGGWEVLESSEARTVKDALKRSEEKLRSLFINMSEGFAYHRIVVDKKGKPCDYIFLEINDAFERLTGLKGKDIIGKKVTEALPGIDKDSTDWIVKYGKVALTGKPVQFDSFSERLKKWFSISAFSPHKGYFAVTFSDITERKRYERELVRSKEEWERTFDSVPDMIALLDNKHRIIRVNRAMADQLGFKPEECVGLPCYKYVHGLSEPPAFCPHSLTLKDGCEHMFELFEEKLGGEMLVSTTPIFNDRDEIAGSVHVARNISELKQVEKELRHRTAELEAVNRELETFSYSVSHDLRAPLRSIDGFSRAIIEDYADKLDAAGTDNLNRVISASRKMERIIEALLDMAKMTGGGIKKNTVNLSSIAQVAAYELKKRQPERQVELIITDKVKVNGDINMLRVVIENLFENAFKYTGRHPSATIEFGVTRANDKDVYFVRDNGAGFDMSFTDKLFKPFQRLHTESEFPGIGIGLSTVQRIILRHGGSIWAESAPEEGATFYFTL